MDEDRPLPPKAFTDHEVVEQAYLGLLGRPADPAGLAGMVRAIRSGEAVESILRTFTASPEYLEAQPGQYPFDLSPPRTVETNVPSEALDRLWTRVSDLWSRLGEAEPYWSVLTDESWRAENIGAPDAVESFYASAEPVIRRMDAWLDRNGQEIRSDGVCAEYGCGVGRLTEWLAPRFGKVVAFDVSAPHLRVAEARMREKGLTNVEFVQVRGRAELERLQGADMFFSIISLQHSPPPIIADVLLHAMAGLNPDGLCFFQTLVDRSDYAFEIDTYLANAASEEMEMHPIPQREVFELMRRHGVQPLEVQPDGYVGAFRRLLSYTFLGRKQGGSTTIQEA